MFYTKKMYYTLDRVLEEIKEIKFGKFKGKIIYPMIILKTPKGFTGPEVVDGKQIAGTFRAHQVPVQVDTLEHIEILEKWLRSYRPEELFDKEGHLDKDIYEIIPTGRHRMGANPNANGGLLRRIIKLPDVRDLAVKSEGRGTYKTQDMLELSKYIRDVYKLNDNFRLFCPDEAMSNRLYEIFKATDRDWQEEIKDTDEYLSNDGRIIDSFLSEHFCEGLLEGYLLTGRHGVFVSYEAFIRVIDSMAGQHAKWLRVCQNLKFRRDISSLNYVLTSNVWQQDHNGYTHQDPGFLNHMATKKDSIVRMYLPADANSLLVCFDECMKSKNQINIMVASKHPSMQWLSIDEAKAEFDKGLAIWKWVSDDADPDIVMVSIGDCPTLEMLAATKILKENFPDLKIRFINVLDLMCLKKSTSYFKSLSDDEFDEFFTADKPVIVAFHGYPSLIYEFTYFRHNRNITVHGYREEGTITTPFDMRVLNEIDRYHLVIEAINHLDLGSRGDMVLADMERLLKRHYDYIRKYGADMPEVTEWKW